jgi:hypothetical protein
VGHILLAVESAVNTTTDEAPPSRRLTPEQQQYG